MEIQRHGAFKNKSTFGYCEETGEEIGLKRLEARPVATYTLEAQERREITEKQISEWIGEGHKGLFLRPNGDYRPDEVFKSELADQFEELGGKIDLVFDDRNKVVDMWRARGTTVVQVAEGDF